jgi:hypothetical protein
MCDQRRRRRLAVGAGDGDQRHVRRNAAALTAEQLDVADHFDAGLLRELYAPVRRGVRQRNARRQNKCHEFRPIGAAQIGGDNARGPRLRYALRIVVGGDDIGAAGHQRFRARKPGTAETKYRDLFAGKGRDRNHDEVTAASGSKAPPARARPRQSKNE